jgi:ketopantoate reductase
MLAAGLLEHGLRFRWLVRNPARRRQLDIPAIEFDGERRRLAMAPHTVVDSTTELHDCDWLILVVKAQQVVSVLAELPAGCPALVVANGLHTGPFHLGLLYGGAYLALDGTAVFRAGNELWAGPLGLPAEDPAAAGSCLDPLLAQLNSAWLTTHYVPEVRQRM